MGFTEGEIQETLQHLKKLIRFDTTNPPGMEMAACEYLALFLDGEQIPWGVFESKPGRGNVIGRLYGDGSRRPLMLTSHLDVVPCERERWAVDPFAAVVQDGFIWGRGAVDMKNMTALALTIMAKAKREKLPLKRDLIFVAVADEEAGCACGSQWLIENQPDLLNAEYALNEVGGFSLHVGEHVFYPIGVAEKGLCWFKIVAKGEAGHSAMPPENQAIAHLCRAGQVLTGQTLPFHHSAAAGRFVDEIAARQGFPARQLLKGLQRRSWHKLIVDYLMPDKQAARRFKTLFHNLATPTILRAGYKENVVPATAELVVDGRILPGSTVKQFLQEVQTLIGPGYEIEVLQQREAHQSDYDNSFFNTLKEKLIKFDPRAIPVPFLIPGFTDASHYAKLGIKCYGYVPTLLPPGLDFAALYHGHNERLPLEAIPFGLSVLWDVVLETCC